AARRACGRDRTPAPDATAPGNRAARPAATPPAAACRAAPRRGGAVRTGARKLGLEPAAERAVEQWARDVVGRDLEARIHAGLDRTLAQQVGTERVDGADP